MCFRDTPVRSPAPLVAAIAAITACAAAVILAGCTTWPGAAPAEGPASAPASAPAAPASTDAPPTPPPASPAATAAMREQAQRIAQGAIELLDTGREDQARDELAKALVLDPSNHLAQKLLHEITADPWAEFGRESFAYRVQANDSLSKIAGRFLGDVQAFYLLARYNEIKVPRQVAEGQVIRVPGKAPARLEATPAAPSSSSSPTPAPSVASSASPPAIPVQVAPPAPPAESAGQAAWRKAQAAEKAGDLAAAYEQYRLAAAADHPGAAGKATELGHRLAARYATEARLAYSNKDLPAAMRSWDKVLAIEPDNASARLERARAADLFEKYKKL